MASLGSEAGPDDPAEGSPLVGLAGSLPTLTIYPFIYHSRRSESAQRRDWGATARAAARRERPLDRIHPAERNRQSHSPS